MKVSELRGIINEISNTSDDFQGLDQALKRFDDMELSIFSKLLKKVPATAPKVAARTKNKPESKRSGLTIADIAAKLLPLKADPARFDAEIDQLGGKRSFTKKDMQALFGQVFQTTSTLPLKLSKSEMVARFKRQRRRDSNFASA